MDFFCGESAWIAPDDRVSDSAAAGRVMLFRKRFRGRGKLLAAVSADSEYRLFCNGREVAQGPAAGDREETFFDSVDLSGCLQDGENEILAEVVGFASAFPDFAKGGAPMGRMAVRDSFILSGTLVRPDGTCENLSTGKGWEAAQAPDLTLVRCPGIPAAGPGEHFQGGIREKSVFSPARILETGFRADHVKNTLLPYRLTPRRIPDMRRTLQPFKSVFDCTGAETGQITSMLQNGTALQLSPESKADFVLDMEEETSGRLLLEVLRGTGVLKLVYAENLSDGNRRHFCKTGKHDPVSGFMTDQVSASGTGFVWKSFFYRAFRFVRVTAEAGKEGLVFRLNRTERETYPYEYQGSFRCSDSRYNLLWEMGKRTLELCSHQTFEDCPYYERLQYAADSRIAAQIACRMTGDIRLAEQALNHFRHSAADCGLTAGSYPSRSPVLLPLWSLHYVMMTQELYEFSGKKEILQENLPALRRVLNWFMQHRLPGGGIGRLPYWNMADFSKDWSWNGEPPGLEKHASAYVTFFVMECLDAYARMASCPGCENEQVWAEHEYRRLKQDSRIFYDRAKGFFADTPEGASYSLLANAQAVLAGAAEDTGFLCRAYDAPDVKRASPFGSNFVFRAFLKNGFKEYAEKILEESCCFLEDGRSVFPEGTPIPRSECHIWSALPPAGLAALYTGFRILEPGGKRLYLEPWKPGKTASSGTIPLPCGMVQWDFSAHACRVLIPKGISVTTASGQILNGTDGWTDIPF